MCKQAAAEAKVYDFRKDHFTNSLIELAVGRSGVSIIFTYVYYMPYYSNCKSIVIQALLDDWFQAPRWCLEAQRQASDSLQPREVPHRRMSGILSKER